MPSLRSIVDTFYVRGIQLSPAQVEVVGSVVRARQPGCRFLIFGAGTDSPLWYALNSGGHTLFVEDVPSYIEDAMKVMPQARIIRFDYLEHTNVFDSLTMGLDRLEAIAMPGEIEAGKPWDVILIDGPRGYAMRDPGRTLPILWTSRIMSRATHVFVDDYNRPVEKHFTDLLVRFDNPPCVVLENEREAGKRMLWRLGRSLVEKST